jgi:hypothetical protein
MSETEGFPPEPLASDPVPIPGEAETAPAGPEPTSGSAPTEAGPAPPTATDIPDGTAGWLRRILEHLLGE